MSALEPANQTALRTIQAAVEARTKDWRRFQEHAVAFHLKNAAAWANAATGQDLASQIDAEFRHGPQALSAAAPS
jgi:CO dehydrogenase maturation factor